MLYCNILDSLNLEMVSMVLHRTFFRSYCSTTVTCWKKSWILFRVSRDHLSIQSMKLQQRESRRLQRLFHHFMFSFSFSFSFCFFFSFKPTRNLESMKQQFPLQTPKLSCFKWQQIISNIYKHLQFGSFFNV